MVLCVGKEADSGLGLGGLGCKGPLKVDEFVVQTGRVVLGCMRIVEEVDDRCMNRVRGFAHTVCDGLFTEFGQVGW